jgi:CHAD domain-containing protein
METPDSQSSRPELSFRDNARELLPAVLEAFYSHAPEGSVEPEVLHELRIAAKRLRYSLEFFESCYGKRLANYIEAIRDLQELLGDIHDCDVMIGVLQKRRGKLAGKENSDLLVTGIDGLISDFEGKRARTASDFAALWQRRFNRGFKTRLLKVLAGTDA